MTVWTVWQGEYSDRIMLAAFSAKEKATGYIAFLKSFFQEGRCYCDDEPIEYALDAPTFPPLKSQFLLSRNFSGEWFLGGPYESIDDYDKQEDKIRYFKDGSFQYEVWVNSSDYETMKKAAYDHIAVLKAEEGEVV